MSEILKNLTFLLLQLAGLGFGAFVLIIVLALLVGVLTELPNIFRGK